MCCLKPKISRFFATAVNACMDLLRNCVCVIFVQEYCTLLVSHWRSGGYDQGAGLFKVRVQLVASCCECGGIFFDHVGI